MKSKISLILRDPIPYIIHSQGNNNKLSKTQKIIFLKKGFDQNKLNLESIIGKSWLKLWKYCYKEEEARKL